MNELIATALIEDDPLDREVDFSKALPNPYWVGVVDRRCVRLLDSDLADSFPDNASVNVALRTIADAAARTQRKVRPASAKPRRKARSPSNNER